MLAAHFPGIDFFFCYRQEFIDRFAECRPVYEELPGWQASTVGITRYEDLPANARDYLQRIEELAGIPIDIISTGPDREQTIIKRHPFE